MLQVRKDLCLGCGICAQSCPQGAISILRDYAEINQRKCNSCGRCVEICHQEAIVGSIPVSREELAGAVAGLKRQVDDLLAGIERLRH